ncbi:MAG: hypothetical protein DI539_24590 [Flavobacterium psychrophilum]|nr:MAG: hypothetical protein DI539_24590 [Flavobacterium psychrophilum]
MKLLLSTLLLITGTQCDSSTMVYLCDSKNAIRYHYQSDCRGLSNCKYRIIKTALESAQSSGKTLCKWEQRTPKP